jgi:copper homeostasis protein
MPGSGLNSNNVKHIIETTDVTEVHTSARIIVPSASQYQNPAIQENFENDFVNVAEIQNIKSIITSS